MKKIFAIVLALLGKKEFEKKDGKPHLTEEQLKKVKGLFGDEFAQEVVDALANETSEEAEEEEASDESGAALVQLITGLTNKSLENMQAIQLRLDKTLKENKELAASIAALVDQPEPDPVPEMDSTIPRKADKPSIFKVDMRKPHYHAVGHFLKSGRMVEVEAATIDVADLATEFGTYLSQNRNNLEMVETLFQGFTSAKYFTNTMAITEWRATQALITSVSQQFNPKWTPSGQSKFRPLTIRNRRHKINLPIIPAEVLESYMMFMYDEGLAPDQMPITKWIWMNLVYPQLMQDIELRMMFKGKYVEKAWNTVNSGDAGDAPENAMDGIETILVDNKAGGNEANIRYFGEGDDFDFLTATDDEILEFVQNFVDWIAPLFRTQQMPLFCSDEFFRRYKRAYKAKWGPGSNSSDNPQFGSNTIDFSRQILTPLDGMYNSPILFTTPKVNQRKLRHKNDVPNVIKDVQKQDYEVRLFGEYWLGGGFAYGEAVFAAVKNGYDPKAEITRVYGAHTTYQQNKGTVSGSGSGSGAGGI